MRIQLSLPGTVGTLLRDAEIYKSLEEAHHVSIAKEVRQESRPRLGDWGSEELTPIQALRIYLETRNTPRERQEVLVEYGERLMRQG